jgi:threonine/homoserine/homoserine lactone efflux protein
VVDSAYAFAAGTLGAWLRGNLKFLRAQRWFAGTTLIGLGLAAAFSGSARSQ